MSSPIDPQPTDEPVVRAQPSTQEIPVAAPAAATPQLPPHPGATTPAPVQTAQPTGPVGLVPGLPGPLPPPPPPASAPAAPAASGSSGSSASSATAEPPPPAADQPATAEQSATTDRPEAAPRTAAVRDRATLLGLGLVVAAVVLLELGLGLRFGGRSFWSDIPLWSAFATVCTVLGLAGSASLLPTGGRLSAATGWRVAAGGLTGLAVFWLLVVLPVVAGDRGFLLTAALGCLGAALWVGPARRS